MDQFPDILPDDLSPGIEDIRNPSKSRPRRPHQKGKHQRPTGEGRNEPVKNIQVAHEDSDSVVYANEMSESVREVMETNYEDSQANDSEVNLTRKKSNRLDQKEIGIIIGKLCLFTPIVTVTNNFNIHHYDRRPKET